MSISLLEIADQLFGIPDDFLECLAQGQVDESVLPEEVRECLYLDNVQERLKVLGGLSAAETDTGAVATERLRPPESIMERARQKTEAIRQARDVSFDRLVRGVIVRTRPIDAKNASIEGIRDSRSPVAIVLYAPQVDEDGEIVDPTVWSGWVASPYVDFATTWDLILDPNDEPINPEWAMIHCWNFVTVKLDFQHDEIIGVLSAERFRAVCSIANECLAEAYPDEEPIVGFVGMRETADGLVVLTGTGLGDDDDPRFVFRRLYNSLGDELKSYAISYLQDQAAEMDNATGAEIIPLPRTEKENVLRAMRRAREQNGGRTSEGRTYAMAADDGTRNKGESIGSSDEKMEYGEFLRISTGEHALKFARVGDRTVVEITPPRAVTKIRLGSNLYDLIAVSNKEGVFVLDALLPDEFASFAIRHQANSDANAIILQ
jgi:hypothetical protein